MMDSNNKSQTARDHNTFIQLDSVNDSNIIIGPPPSEIIKIVDYLLEIRDKTLRCSIINEVDQRIKSFKDEISSRTDQYQTATVPSIDPSALLDIDAALKTSIKITSPSNRKILTDLLLDKIRTREDKNKKLALSKAIEIADSISEDALIGLIVSTPNINLVNNSFKSAFSEVNDLLEKVIGSHELPTGTEWLDNLFLSGAIRFESQNSKFTKFDDNIKSTLSKHFITGVSQNSPEHLQVIKLLQKCGLPAKTLIPHDLRPGFLVFPTTSLERTILTKNNNRLTHEQFDTETKNCLREIFKITCQPDPHNKEMLDELVKLWHSYPTLDKIARWRDKNNQYFIITPIGKVLANAYIDGRIRELS